MYRGLKNEKFDKESRVITAEFETFFLIHVYAPHSGINLKNSSKRLKWNDAFLEYALKLDEIEPTKW